MSDLLIVDDEEKLTRRVWPKKARYDAGVPEAGRPSQSVTSWRDFPTRVRETHPGDMVVLNLDSRDAPPLREAMLLREAQPGVGFVYVVDVNENARNRALAALSKPGVHWVSSQASDTELRLRLNGLANSIAQPRPAALARPAARSPWEHLMPALHNPASGRLDAARIAEWFGMPLKAFAAALGRGYAAVHKTPDAFALQDNLKVFLRVASALSRLAGSHEGAKVWLNAPNPDLEGRQTPLSAIASGEQTLIAELLEDALHGQPG